MGFMVTAASGLFGLVLMMAVIAIPYFRRGINRRFGPGTLKLAPTVNIHLAIAYLLLATAMVHMYASMGGGMAMRVNMNGITVATVGLTFLLAQAGLGLTRPKSGGDGFLVWRRMHFFVMVCIVVAVTVHVWLNGMLIYKML